ncbi:MAG: SRPBCC family protein [Chloroflexota bacterium]|nr:SRPBCC family protein [Chloroflexota bacterium]
MSQVTKRIPISASADEVWQVLADFGGVERWAPTVLQSHCSTEVHRGLGAKRILTTSTGETTEEVIVEWNEGHSFTFEIPDGLVSIIKILRETWSVEHSSQGTEVAVIMDYQMKDGIVYSILDALVAKRALKKMLVQNLAGLKQHIETGEIVTHRTTNLPVESVV